MPPNWNFPAKAGPGKREQVKAGPIAETRHPRAIAEYIRTYHEERKRLAAQADVERNRIELRLGEINREGSTGSLTQPRRAETIRLMVDPASTEIVALHPAVLALYEQQLVELQDALSKGIRAGDSEAADAIRELISDRVPRFLP